MNCLTKFASTIVFVLLFGSVALISNAATYSETWDGNSTIGPKTYSGNDNVYNINLTGDVTLAGAITIDRHVTVNITNTSGSSKIIKVISDVSPLFKNMGTLNIHGGNETNRIIIDGGADLKLNDKQVGGINDIGTIYWGSYFVRSGNALSWEMIGSQGNLSLKYVTIQNYENLSQPAAGAIKLGCSWLGAAEAYMGATTIDHCIFQYLNSLHGSAIYMTGAMTESSNATPQNRNQVTITNSVFRYCCSKGHSSNQNSSTDFGGVIYTENGWTGQMHMTNTEMHHNWTPNSCACIKWTALGYSWVKLFIKDGCNFHDNYSGADAGAIYVETLCEFEASDSIRIKNNQCVGHGGGLFIKPMNLSDKITGPYNYTLPSTLVVENNNSHSTMALNSYKGGGVAVCVTGDCNLTAGSTINLNVNGAIIRNNESRGEGGGIYFTHENTNNNYTCNVFLNKGTIAYNKVRIHDGTSNGGGLYTWRTNILNNSSQSGTFLFYKNHCEGYGGGICQQNGEIYDVDGFAASNESRIELSNSQMSFVSANEALRGGAIAGLNSDAITLENITFNGNGPTHYGNGLWTQDCKSVNLNGCSFTGNNGCKYGGGIYANHVILSSVNTNYERNNSSYRGAGLYITNNSTATITGGLFYKNKLTGAFHDDEKPGYEGYGAGLYFGNGGNLTVSNVTFNNNEVKANTNTNTNTGGGGGAIAIVNQRYVVTDDNYKFTEVEVDHAVPLTKCTLEGISLAANTANSGDGGGIMIRSVNEDTQELTIEKAKVVDVTIKSSTMKNCNATRGGAILADGNDWGLGTPNQCYDDIHLTMEDVTLTDNIATYGGAIGICQAQGTFKSGTIYNNSATADVATGVSATGGMWDNNAKGFGGGIFVSGSALFNIIPADGALCAIYGNNATNGGNDIVVDGSGWNGTTQVNLPDLATVNLGTYTGEYSYPVSQRAMGWVEDYNTGDSGYSSGFALGTAERYKTKRENRSSEIKNTLLSAEQRVASGNVGKYLSLSAGFPIYYVTLKKNGLEPGESAIFNIYGGSFTFNKPYLTTILTGDGGESPTCKVALTPGPWTIEETNWSWSYSPQGDKKITKDVSLDENKDNTVYEFTNVKQTGISPGAESKQKNEFNNTTN